MSGLLGGHPRRCSAVRTMRRLVGLLARLFPRPFTIYAGRAEDVSLGLSELARALTNSENRKQRGGERAARGCGTGAGLASRPRRGRNGETNGDGSYSKDYGKTKGRGVNQRAGESVELDNLAPQEEPCSEQTFGEPEGNRFLRPVNRAGRFRRREFPLDVWLPKRLDRPHHSGAAWAGWRSDEPDPSLVAPL